MGLGNCSYKYKRREQEANWGSVTVLTCPEFLVGMGNVSTLQLRNMIGLEKSNGIDMS